VKWIVYILECSDHSLYTGITLDLEKRLDAHRLGTASKYTRSRLPVRLVYEERCPSRPDALRREIIIKQMKRSDKLDLIAGPDNRPPDGGSA
jgi:putative endonuclease